MFGMCQVKEEVSFSHNEYHGKYRQQSGLDDLGIRVGGEYFIEVTGSDVKYHCNQNVPAGFVIQPVHDDDKRENTDQEVRPMNPAGLDDIAMVIIING